jgi:hypothetical protein
VQDLVDQRPPEVVVVEVVRQVDGARGELRQTPEPEVGQVGLLDGDLARALEQLAQHQHDGQEEQGVGRGGLRPRRVVENSAHLGQLLCG